MTFELLTDMYDAAPELWFVLFWVLAVLLFSIGYLFLSNLKLRQKNYFINRDRERYAETLYASKDGYFAFIHPDRKVNDPRQHIFERCSRRLAVILNLPNGTSSTFEDVLKCFYKDDVKKIQKYIELLSSEGASFEEEFLLKTSDKQVRLAGSRINGIDGNIYCDMIWVRDVSFEASVISKLKSQQNEGELKIRQMQDMFDNMSYPVWLRDEKANIIMVNKKYLDFAASSSRENAIEEKLEIIGANGESVSKNIAFLAIKANKPKVQKANINRDGIRLTFQVTETPFYAEEKLDKIYTVGTLIDISELDNFKRDMKSNQNTHLEILGSLGTAFAVFDAKYSLTFYNQAFGKLWGLDDKWLESQPNYSVFLDEIRSSRMLPEVPDFRHYKSEEQKDFMRIIEPKEDMLHLPNGKTFRRVRAPHPMGGLVFAFEDVSDKLATKRAYNSLLIVRSEILNNLFDAVLIFASDGRLKFYNRPYIKMWNVKDGFLQKEPSILEIIESQREFFKNVDNWQGLKEEMLTHIINVATKTFSLNRNDGVRLNVLSSVLSDGSIMVTYKKID